LKEETLKSHGLENVSIVELFFFFFFINRYTFFLVCAPGYRIRRRSAWCFLTCATSTHSTDFVFRKREKKKTLIDLGGKPQDILLLLFFLSFFKRKFGEYLG
jgi:hypothetical protein